MTGRRNTCRNVLLAGVLIALANLILPGPAFARPLAGASADDETEIAKLVASEASGWNAGDAALFSKDVAEDVAFVNIMGTSFRGKAAFEKQHARIFATIYKGSHLATHVDRVQMLSADVAYVEVGMELTGFHGVPPGISAPPDGVMRTRCLEVFKKGDGGWKIETFYNVVALPVPSAPPAQK